MVVSLDRISFSKLNWNFVACSMRNIDETRRPTFINALEMHKYSQFVNFFIYSCKIKL